ncbi:hypothetical protein TrRE_jg9333 [Triparma retinervis]|uniref:peptidylprolyl isomerase n=1 Tax=Triparma retinervis TaxID=2557542 RepID=A0A9W6ZWJ9_9STRA|nr:hypothetical protein TrRE_jg9333 [Triparma retinervis]
MLAKTLAFRAPALVSRRMSTRMFSSATDNPPMYALGLNLAKQIGGQFNGLIDKSGPEMDAVIAGFRDSMKDELLVDPNAYLQEHGPELNKILQERAAGVVDKMKDEGKEFAEEFLSCNEDAVKTDSGIIYLPMTEGEGASPTISSSVEVHYHGQLTDGTVFDSSVQRGQTISFPLSNVIKGWQEGLQMMKEGGKATLVIPSDLAYGDQGSGETIPPGATLKFEVELFKVENAPENDGEIEIEMVN